MVKTILVVEDDLAIRTLLAQAISDETPYQAMVVGEGKQALQAVKGTRPHLFILDYNLPGSMDGLELYDRLHVTEGLEHIPAIMMSACMPEREVATRGILVMRKPFDLQTFLDTLQWLLG